MCELDAINFHQTLLMGFPVAVVVVVAVFGVAYEADDGAPLRCAVAAACPQLLHPQLEHLETENRTHP